MSYFICSAHSGYSCQHCTVCTHFYTYCNITVLTVYCILTHSSKKMIQYACKLQCCFHSENRLILVGCFNPNPHFMHRYYNQFSKVYNMRMTEFDKLGRWLYFFQDRQKTLLLKGGLFRHKINFDYMLHTAI